ncbi:hypothetical protein M3A74_07615 [Corynebacterium appendicis]|uniref:hypothetical protein n=1 Tax=Corynebacterium appendicis TaxID=163202 RepID=UPI00223A7637|nr:hypothetical protein [Corynebacterium appendicis]MCT1684673.1 hypothetical protein [Corynebacterium appendicis]
MKRKNPKPKTETNPKGHEECDTDPANAEIHRAVDEVNDEYPNRFGGSKFTGRTN